MNRLRRRWIWWLLGGGIAASLAWSLVPTPLSVEATRVVRGPLIVTIDEDARTRMRDRYTVAAPADGFLSRIALRPGANVRAGQVVAEILPGVPPPVDARSRAQLHARVEAAIDAQRQARVRLDSARAAFAQAAHELNRLGQLERDRVVSNQELETARTRHDVAEADVNVAAAGVDVADHELEAARATLLSVDPARGRSRGVGVRAPENGSVLRVFEESERPIQAGTPLLEIGVPSTLEVVADLLSTDAVQVPAGAAVLLDRWGGPGTLQGRVRTVEPFSFTKVSALGVEEQRVNVLVDFLDQPDVCRTLGDGFALEVRIVVWEATGAIKVPIGALFREGTTWFVYKLVDSHAIRQRIRISRMSDREAGIEEGLMPDDLVIVHPGEQISDGVRVTVR